MQNIIFYVAANETLGAVKDYANAKTMAAPTLVRGAGCCLRMRVFENADGETPYPVEELASVAAWEWVMDTDFNGETAYKLVADAGSITVDTVTAEIDGNDHTYTEFTIPISNMNTEELAALLGTSEAISNLAGELCGYAATGELVFIVQVKGFTVRNRVASVTAPTELESDYLTAAQVRALVAAGVAMQYAESAAGDWHDIQSSTDTHLRVRSASDDAAVWSAPIMLVRGPQGQTGQSVYPYYAWATDDTGAGFILDTAQRTSAHKYLAILMATVEITAPAAEDFAGLWVKVVGDDGQGVGDMTKAVYDTNGDGIVDKATSASTADAVPWAGVTGKPGAFTPAAHTHSMVDIADAVRQKEYSASGSNKTLYLDCPIIRNTTSASGTIDIDFTAIAATVGGDLYTGTTGDVFTWEYHLRATGEITGINIGSNNSTMAGVNIPDSLPLVNDTTTYHVFVVRGVYKSGAVNNIALHVNYAYSYEA